MNQASLKNSFIDLKNIKALLNQHLHLNITQSVVDLVNCYFCLDKVKDPLLCPKCHNFACKQCLKKYFGTQIRKKCGLCKQDISFSELQENKVVKEIENILSTDKSKKSTVDELAKVIKEKKEFYQKEQTNLVNDIINRFIEYQECLEKYKNAFNEYLSDCQKLVEKTFNNYYSEIQDLIISLSSYSNIYQKTIDKYDEIYKKAKENYFNNENIKELINEILYLEKKQLNGDDKSEAKNFLLSPISFKPYFQNYSLISYQKACLDQSLTTFEDRRLNFGRYILKLSRNDKIYNFKLKLNLESVDYERQFLIKISKKGDSARDFIMKLVTKDDLEYNYECDIEENCLFISDEKEIEYSIDILEMDTYVQ